VRLEIDQESVKIVAMGKTDRQVYSDKATSQPGKVFLAPIRLEVLQYWNQFSRKACDKRHSPAGIRVRHVY